MTQAYPPAGDAPPAVPGAAPPPPRPAIVTTAAAAMVAVVVLSLIGAVISVVARDIVFDTALEQARQDQNAAISDAAARRIANLSVFFGIAVALVTAIGFLTLAVLNLRGNNVARIITWVVCGLFLFCGLGLLAPTLGAVGQYPGWLSAWVVGSSIATTVLYISIIVLLALPASNAFFKPRAQSQF